MSSALFSSASASPPPESDISIINPRTHLFFDDKPEFIRDVRDAVTATGIPLVAIECPPGEVELYDDKGSKVKINPDIYNRIKSTEVRDRQFKEFLLDYHKETEIGNGITIPIIQQIIDFEELPANPKERIYFFDFDKLLSQTKSVSFAFGDRKVAGDISRKIPAYAKYIFSDHIGPEPANGRLRLLKTMFEKIGPRHIYIITSNNLANDQIINIKSKKLDTNPYKQYFVELIRELLPSFDETHLICTYKENTPPLFNNKGQAIVHILREYIGSPKGSTTPRASASASPRGSTTTPRASASASPRGSTTTPRASASASPRGRVTPKTISKTNAKGSPPSGMGGGLNTRSSRNKKRKTRRNKYSNRNRSRKLQSRRKCRRLRRQ